MSPENSAETRGRVDLQINKVRAPWFDKLFNNLQLMKCRVGIPSQTEWSFLYFCKDHRR
jgi:hypothetical protein